MTKLLFESHITAALADAVRDKVNALSQHMANSPANIAAREKALEAYQGYPHRDKQGRPIAPDMDSDYYHKMIFIPVTSDEARMVGTSDRQISIDYLNALADDTAPETPEITVVMRSYAAHLLAMGQRNYERYSKAVAADQAGYEAARAAFDVLSHPFQGNFSDTPQSKLADALIGKLKVAHAAGRKIILLAASEHKALLAGKFGEIEDAVFEKDEQRRRAKINESVADSNQRAETHPFEAVFDPARMREIERLLAMDITGQWILEAIKKGDLPVFLSRYTVSDVELWRGGSLGFGLYVKSMVLHSMGLLSHLEKVAEYIRLFTNLSNNFDIAGALAHEGRHFWQSGLFTGKEMARRSPLDNIINAILEEADAHAIQEKIEWVIHRKTGHTSLRMANYAEFDRHINNPAWRSLSPSQRLSLATQARFIEFIEKEFAKPRYLARAIKKHAGGLGRCDAADVAASRLLSDEFFDRLSRVREKSRYLDEKGMARIRQIFTEKLPQAVRNGHRPGAARGKKPSFDF